MKKHLLILCTFSSIIGCDPKFFLETMHAERPSSPSVRTASPISPTNHRTSSANLLLLYVLDIQLRNVRLLGSPSFEFLP